MKLTVQLLFFVISQAFYLSCCCCCWGLDNFNNVSLHKKFQLKSLLQQQQELIGNSPMIVLLDVDESDLELEVRDALYSKDNVGYVIYTFNPWWRFSARGMELKPRVSSAKTSSPFLYTFVCLLEERRTKVRAERYLEELLAVGHGREDRFILLGEHKVLATFMRSNAIDKFLNMLVVPVDKQNAVVYQRRFGKERDDSRFELITDFKHASWYNGRTESLNGKHFQISGTKFPPYLDSLMVDGKPKLMGVNYQIFNQGKSYFNYTFEVNKQSTWKLTGKTYSNGTFDGVFGDVVYGKADIASVSTQTVSRFGFADFVGPFGRAHFIFVTSVPETFLGKYAIIRSYTLDVWGLILAFYLVFVFLLHKALQLSEKGGSSNKTLMRAFITLWSLSLEQTLEKRPKGTRLVMILWVLFAIVILTGYRSNMSAFISFPELESKPKNLEELDKARSYKIYFDLSGISAYQYFEESNKTLIRNLKLRAIAEGNTTSCVVSAFMDRNTVCLGWDFTLKMSASRLMTIPQFDVPLFSSQESILNAWYTFALTKNSIYTKAFQFIGQSCFETGLTGYWRNRILNQYRRFSIQASVFKKNTSLYRKLDAARRKNKNDTKPLKVENVQFVFLMLFGGIGVSLVGFLYEIANESMVGWWRRYKMVYHHNTSKNLMRDVVHDEGGREQEIEVEKTSRWPKVV